MNMLTTIPSHPCHLFHHSGVQRQHQIYRVHGIHHINIPARCARIFFLFREQCPPVHRNEYVHPIGFTFKRHGHATTMANTVRMAGNIYLFILLVRQYIACSCVYCNVMKIKVIAKNSVLVCFHAFSLMQRSVYCNVYSFCVCRG